MPTHAATGKGPEGTPEPGQQCCYNMACPLRGQVGQGNIRLHSRRERRYRCVRCGQTFAASSGKSYYRLHQIAR
ncbi:MAG: hypothetical protein M1296_05335 [Chloroflexi bacterium]|nr:hypothetical protein [Chloroflexota bacterium]